MRKLDDGYEPERCVENTRKLIADDVFALFGYIGTPTSIAALPLATKARVPFIAPFTGAMALREPFNKYAFHVRASYNDETALIVKQLTHLGLKKIAVFYQNDAYGKAGLDGVTLALDALSLKPVALATVERNSVDVAQAVKTLVAAGPRRGGADRRLQGLRRFHSRGAQGGLWRHLLQRVVCRHAGAGRRAGQGRRGRGGVAGHALALQPGARHCAEFAEAVKAAGSKDVQANFSSMEGYLAAKLLAKACGVPAASPAASR